MTKKTMMTAYLLTKALHKLSCPRFVPDYESRFYWRLENKRKIIEYYASEIIEMLLAFYQYTLSIDDSYNVRG